MQRLSFAPPLSSSLALILCLAVCSFHGNLNVRGQDFTFPSGKLTNNSLTAVKSGVVDSAGTLVLDASAGDAQAFYASPISLYSTTSSSVLSFSTFFTFSSNATSGNGTVAFVVVPDAAATGGLTAARSTFTVEFNTSCSTGEYNGSGYYGGGSFHSGGGWGGRGRGSFGGLGGFQVVQYANNTAIAAQAVSGYGPNWSGQPADGTYFCSQQPPADLATPTFQYQVVLEYNATTDTVWVGSPSCGAAIARTTQFAAHDLSDVITKPVYVGFIVTNGGVFNLSQWNFTSNATTNSVSSLALSSSVVDPTTSTPAGVNGGDGGYGGGSRHGDKKLGKGYVIGFSVLGAAIAIGAVLAVCCLCAYRRRRRAASGARFAAKGSIPESKVVFDAAKPPAAPMPAERDTAPLNHPTTSHGSNTGTASWLPPVAPR